MKKSDIGDIIEVVILLVILVVGFFYTMHGLIGGSSVSGSHNRYYEAREVLEYGHNIGHSLTQLKTTRFLSGCFVFLFRF